MVSDTEKLPQRKKKSIGGFTVKKPIIDSKNSPSVFTGSLMEKEHRWFFTVILRFFRVELSVVRFARGLTSARTSYSTWTTKNIVRSRMTSVRTS